MLTIDTSLLYQAQYYELNTKRMNTNAYESIDAYTEAHAAKGTPESQAVKNQNLDQDTIIKALKLHLPNNRLSILRLLNHSELVNLLSLLEKGNLVLGLKFFTKDKLVQNIFNLSKEDILKILFKIYSKDQLLQMFPIKDMMGILSSSKIPTNDFMKIINSMPRTQLTQLLESMSGKPAGNKSSADLLKEIGAFRHDQLVEGLRTSLPYKELLSFVGSLVNNNSELMSQFSKGTLVGPIESLGKSSIVEGMMAIDSDQIMKMLNELPKNMLAVIDTMIPQDKLTEYLQKYHSDLLSSMVQ